MHIDEKVSIVTKFGYPAETAQEWFEKYWWHSYSSRERGLDSQLSFEQYMSKVTEASLSSPEQIGRRLGQFVLGRVGDIGNYTADNCRFITTTQNRLEAHENGCYVESYQEKSQSMTGQSKETQDWIRRAAETKTGRTKETHEGVAAMAQKLSGRTKETHPGIATMAERQRGRTKDNHAGTASMAEKLTGRTKETHTGNAAQADKLSNDFVLCGPDGTIYEGRNLKEFCETHGLNRGNMASVCRGDRLSHKGFTGRYVDSK